MKDRKRSSGTACRGLTALFTLWLGLSAERANAQTTIDISTAAPAPAPKLNGALIVGVLANTPLQHTLAATGTPRPTFTATGLPAGLTLDAASGKVSGTLTAAGSHAVTVSATNSAGSDSKTLTIVVGQTLALVPPMGWNSYDSFDDSVRESEFIAQATWIRDNLLPFGWDTVTVDFRWYDPNAPQSDQGGSNPDLTTDANGRFVPAPGRFPSAANGVGFKTLAQQVHDMGLKFGIHIMRGLPRKTYNANTTIAGSTYTAQQAGDTAKVCRWNSDNYGVKGATAAGQAWYDSLFSLYATWGVDFVKVDDITSNPGATDYWADEVEAIHKAIYKSGRSMLLSLSPGETPVGQANHLTMYANLWRQSDDFWDRPGDLNHSFTLAQRWAVVTGPPGHWPDADMLPLGHLGPRCPVDGGNRDTRFSRNEQVLMMTLWTMMPSPLILGTNLTATTDAFTRALLTNEEVLAVNQDVLGARATRVSLQGTTEAWMKSLSGGRKAVALYNRGASDATVSATFTQLGVSGTQVVRDLWRKRDVTGATSSVSASVPGRAALLYTVSPPATGTGGAGMGGSGGAGGAGGAGGPGGASGASGASGGGAGGVGGTVATGGVTSTAGGGGAGQMGGSVGNGGNGGSNASAGSSGAATGGASIAGSAATGGSLVSAGGSSTTTGGMLQGTGGLTSSGGSLASGGSAVAGANPSPSDKSGCSCSVMVEESPQSRWRWLGVVGVAFVALARRRKRGNFRTVPAASVLRG